MDKRIPTKAHGVLDYVTAGALLAAPGLLRLEGASAVVPRVTGATATAYSSVTDYELGLRRLLPMPAHLALDAASGVFLAASPWLFRFARRGRRSWLPHVLVGTMEVAVALLTKRESTTESG